MICVHLQCVTQCEIPQKKDGMTQAHGMRLHGWPGGEKLSCSRALSHSSWALRDKAQEMHSGFCSPLTAPFSWRRTAQLLELSMLSWAISPDWLQQEFPHPTYLWISHHLSLLVPVLAAPWFSPAGEDFLVFFTACCCRSRKCKLQLQSNVWCGGNGACSVIFFVFFHCSSSTESDLLRLILLKRLLMIYVPSSVLILKGWETFGPLH